MQNSECRMQNDPLTDSVGALPRGEPFVGEGSPLPNADCRIFFCLLPEGALRKRWG